MRLLLAGLLLTLSLAAAAQIYSYTDANGNTVYTDEPAPGSNACARQHPATEQPACQLQCPRSATPGHH